MTKTFQTPDWDTYRMDAANPHERLEPEEQEAAVVAEALLALQAAGVLKDTGYDYDRFLAHRAAVRDHFEIPWTAITPRMQRLLYAINAVHRPQVMIAAGVFCGNTFFSNAGAAAGPGASYQASALVGIEIKPEEADRAERNVRRVDPTGIARVVAADAVEWVSRYEGTIHLLYLDADGAGGRGKGVYLDILEEAWEKMPPGALMLAHNSVNCAERLQHYLEFVRNPANCAGSVNIIFDPEGLEVSVKAGNPTDGV